MTEELKPHQIAQLVNKLRDIATKYHAHGCLRELISREVNAALTQRPAAQAEPSRFGSPELQSLIVQHATQQATPEPVGEPFGYFRSLPFGWEQCGEHDDGAVALYDHPAPGGPDTVPVFVRMQGGDGYPTTAQWMGDGIGYLVCVPRDWQAAPGVPDDVLAILDECRNALMECDRDGDYALIDRIDALAAAQAKGGQA